MMEDLSLVQRFTVWVLPVLFAITVHEAAHGWVAKLCGDRTAEKQGRLSLNPLHHVDPVGTIVVPGIMLATGGFVFGWAKPVPVDFAKLSKPKRDMVFVAAAGPLANLLMACAWMLIARFADFVAIDYFSRPLSLMSGAGIIINIMLLMVNLLPIPPLDGGRIVAGLLPNKIAAIYGKIEPYGFLILIGLVYSGLLGAILGAPIAQLQHVLFKAAGL